MFMTKQIPQQDMGMPHSRFHIFFIDPYAHWQGVDEQSHHPVRVCMSLHAPEQNRAEDHILAAGDRGQHPGPGQMAETGCTDSQPARLRARTSCTLGIESQMGY